MPARPKRPAAIALCGAAAIAGCGSGNDQGARLTQQQFTLRANAICRATTKKAPAFPGRRSGAGLVTTARLVTPYLEKTLRNQKQTLTQLRALRPPEAQQKAFDELLSAQEGRNLDLSQALDAARNRDQVAFKTAFQNDQTQDGPRYLRAAKRLGLQDCARGL